MRLCLSLLPSHGSDTALATWEDDDAQKLETRMTDIAIHVILAAEIQYREAALRYHQWRIQRKAPKVRTLFNNRKDQGTSRTILEAFNKITSPIFQNATPLEYA
jgi:hypothetical protein